MEREPRDGTGWRQDAQATLGDSDRLGIVSNAGSADSTGNAGKPSGPNDMNSSGNPGNASSSVSLGGTSKPNSAGGPSIQGIQRPRPSLRDISLEHEDMRRLCEAFLKLNTLEECAALLEDLCSIQELEDMRRRFMVAGLLRRGDNYQQIGQLAQVSSATISRVNRSLRYGAGGYALVLERLDGPLDADSKP